MKSVYCLFPMRTPDMIAETITSRLASLQAGGRLSAWSLIVSFLGDAIGPRGGVVSAGTVQAVMQRLGIGAGAVRTAISRLSADGWIERTRDGRNSFYRLSGDVEETVHAAERRIYARTSLLPADTPRSLIIAGEPFPDAVLAGLEPSGALLLNPQVILCFAAVSELPDSLRIAGATIAGLSSLEPGEAMLLQLADARHFAEFEDLRAAYEPLGAALGQPGSPPAVDAIALRCLMIHEWRRLALRVPAIPADLLPPGDPEPETRALIAGIYAQLLDASEAWLDANATTPSGPLPRPDTRLAQRFGG